MTDDKFTTDIFDNPKNPKMGIKSSKPIDLTDYREHKKDRAGLAKLFDNVNRWAKEGKMLVVVKTKEGASVCLNIESVLRHCEDMGFQPGDGKGNFTHYYYMPGFKYDKLKEETE